jgi:ATP-dependent RNA helicase DDX56/DBP9
MIDESRKSKKGAMSLEDIYEYYNTTGASNHLAEGANRPDDVDMSSSGNSSKSESKKKSTNNKRKSDISTGKTNAVNDISKNNLGKNGYGVVRGIDFQGVAFVVNFDFPMSSAAYTHRIGRTARGGASGTALSFIALSPTGTGAKNSEITASLRDESILQQVA